MNGSRKGPIDYSRIRTTLLPLAFEPTDTGLQAYALPAIEHIKTQTSVF